MFLGVAYFNTAFALSDKGYDAEYTDFEVDPRSSDGKSGLPPKSEYFIPKIPDPTKRDNDEALDYDGTIYSPYGFLRLPYRIVVQTPTNETANQSRSLKPATMLEPGYYLVKIALPPERPSVYQQKRKFPWINKQPARVYEPEVVSSGQMVLKQQGEIIATLDIESQSERPHPDNKKEAKKLAKSLRKTDPIVTVVAESASPLNANAIQLEYCDQNLCFRSRPLFEALLK